MIKILFLAANPIDTAPLRLDEESRSIDKALRQTRFRDIFEFEQHWAVRASDIQDLLLRHKPHIVHFSGHGSAASEIILQDDDGNAYPISAPALKQLFALLKDNIKCVVLNACYSQMQATAIAEVIDCVIGMPDAVDDHSSIKFASSFYRAIGYGRDVKTAYELGCSQLELENQEAHNKPELIASRVDPSQLYFTRRRSWLLAFKDLLLAQPKERFRQWGIALACSSIAAVGVWYFLPDPPLDCRTEKQEEDRIRVLISHQEGDQIRWWVAQDGRGLSTFTCPANDCSEKTFSAPQNFLESELVLAVAWREDRQFPQSIWVSTAAGTLVTLGQSNGRWEQESSIKQAFCPASEIVVAEDQLFLGPQNAEETYLYGLQVTNSQPVDEKQWIKIGPLAITDNLRLLVTDLAYSKDSDTLWVGALTGLYRVSNNVPSPLTPPDWIATQYFPVVSLVSDKTGKLWVGTRDSGLMIFDPVTTQWIQLTGLTSKRIVSLSLKNHRALVGTESGVALCKWQETSMSATCSSIMEIQTNKVIQALSFAPNGVGLIGISGQISVIDSSILLSH